MPTRKKTKDNPFGLTYKQDLVIRDVTEKVKQGKNPDMVASVERFYNVKNNASARSILAGNMSQHNFREALVTNLVEKKILGADSLTETRLIEGLDATNDKGNVDYDARLKYIQEVNKVAGLYAPEIKKTMSLNIDMTEEELDKHIFELQSELD
jgi:hypothetical protein